MKKVWVLAIGGVGAGLLLFAGSCAPAAAPAPAQPAQQQPAQQQPAAKPVEQKPGASQPAAQQPTKRTKSVSGIPLDPDAKYGGILHGTGSLPGQGLIPWEDGLGASFSAAHPPTNKLIRTQTWGSLEDFNRQAYFNLHPDLAVSWEQSPDGLRWTLKLRDGVKWSDGVPFTCEDAKWSLDTIRTGTGLRSSPRATLFLGVDNIQCPDALTMVINMQRRKPSLLEAAIANPTVVILPKHVYADKPDKVEEMRAKGIAVGTGPFVLKEYLPGEKYIFVRKSDYWDAPFPYLDGLENQVLPTGTTAATALRAGRIDLSGSFSGFGGAQHATLSKECKECQFWPRATATNIQTVIPNHQRPPWNTPEIKDALSLAIDRKTLIQTVYLGWGALPAGGGFYPGSYWAMPQERLSQIPGYNFDTPDQNKQRARELLAKAGYKPGELVLPYRTNIADTLPVLVEMWEAVGFKVDARIVENASHYAALVSGDFNVAGIETAISGGIDPDAITYEHFYTGSDRNYGRFSNPRFDALVNEMSVTLDPERRRQLAWDAMEIGLREQGKIITRHIVTASVFGPRVRGLMPGETVAQSAYGPAHRRDHVWLAEK